MDNFCSIFEELSEFFALLRIEDIPHDKLKDFDAYLYIYDDLLNFFDIVFIKKSVQILII